MHECTSFPLREVSFAQPDDHAFAGYGAVFGNRDAYHYSCRFSLQCAR